MNHLKIIFAGTPDFAEAHLKALINSPHQVIAVYTQPDRPSGRGRKIQFSAVKSTALQYKIPIFQPKSLKSYEQELTSLNADIMVVVAYGLILPLSILKIPPLGCINVHASLLPKWRGAAPIQRAIEAGDTETGITIIQMDSGLDTGDMISKTPCPIHHTDTSTILHNKLMTVGQTSLIKALNNISNNQTTIEKQNHHQSNYAKKISKQEARIDWTNNAENLERKVRAFNPWPIMYTMYQQTTIRVWQAKVIDKPSNKPAGTLLQINKEGIDIACKNNILRLLIIQLPNTKAMTVANYINGNKLNFTIGSILT